MEIMKTILNEWENRVFPEMIKRNYNIGKYVSSKLNKIIVLSEFRRIGKTYLLLNEIKNLFIINKDKEEVLEKEWFGIKGKINFIPLWKLCLEERK